MGHKLLVLAMPLAKTSKLPRSVEPHIASGKCALLPIRGGMSNVRLHAQSVSQGCHLAQLLFQHRSQSPNQNLPARVRFRPLLQRQVPKRERQRHKLLVLAMPLAKTLKLPRSVEPQIASGKCAPLPIRGGTSNVRLHAESVSQAYHLAQLPPRAPPRRLL